MILIKSACFMKVSSEIVTSNNLWRRAWSTSRVVLENDVALKKLKRPISSKLIDLSSGKAGKRKIGKSYYVLLVVPCITFGLGVWQIQRRTWKLDLIDKLKTRVYSKPRPFPENPEVLMTKDWEYLPIEVTGTFDHSRELWIRPRSPRQDEEDEDDFRSSSEGPARSGANVVTAFNVKDTNLRILINRGWVDSRRLNPKKRKKGQVTGDQTIVGVVRLKERKVLFNKNNVEQNVWFYRDQDHMAQELNATPIFLDLVEECTPQAKHSPLGGQTRISLRNEHGTYIFIWFSLTFIIAYMWLKRSGLKLVNPFKRKKEKKSFRL